jgi:hypothetical protein
MAWTTPVYDRAQTDIDNKTTKGYYNVADFNRIESDCAYLADYFNLTITTKTWVRTDFPTAAELSRIIANVTAVRAAYYTYITTPATPSAPLTTYQKANDLEQVLNDIYNLYNINLLNLTYCGEMYAGENGGVM